MRPSSKASSPHFPLPLAEEGDWGSYVIVLLVFLFVGSSPARADSNPGITAAPILQIPIGARAVGMGSAFTAVADDITALQYNPAGLSLLQANEANFQYNKGLVDQNIEYMAFGGPLPFRGITGSGYSTLAGSVLFGQNGTIQVNTTNADGSLAGSQSLSAGSDLVATLGYAERVWDQSFESPQHSLHIEHFVGISGKVIHSSLVQQYSATAYAADMGYLARSPEQGWSIGASLLNLGTKMTFISEGDPLPLTFQTGGAYKFRKLPIQGQELTVATDLDYSVYDRLWRVNTGVEYLLLPMFRARIGYQFNQDLAGLTAGFGVEFEGFTIDYAWVMNSDINDTHRVGITYRFGAVSRRERAQQRRPAIETFPAPTNMRDLERQRPEKYELPNKPRENPVPPPGEQEPVWIY